MAREEIVLRKDADTGPDGQKRESGDWQIYDLSYKQMFSHAELVKALLKSILPEEVVAVLDLKTLQQCSSEFVDRLRRRSADMLWRCRTRGSGDRAYFLIEFQSTLDRWMAFRMLEYSCMLLGRLTGEKRLPPVFPIVIYSGPEKWTARTDLSEMRDLPDPWWEDFQPQIRYLLLGLCETGRRHLPGPDMFSHMPYVAGSDGEQEFDRRLAEAISVGLTHWTEQRFAHFLEWAIYTVEIRYTPDIEELRRKHDRWKSEVLSMRNSEVLETAMRLQQSFVDDGIQIGIEQIQRQVAMDMIEDGVPDDKIRQYLRLDTEQLEEVRRKVNGA